MLFQTCAHRYQKRLAGSHSVLGRCYFFSQDLTINKSADMDGGDWKICEGRGRPDHTSLGVCQQGVETTFTNDYHYVVFGAPGAYNWKGHNYYIYYMAAFILSNELQLFANSVVGSKPSALVSEILFRDRASGATKHDSD